LSVPALKGGTALNVFHLQLDRLSVDIDLNYVGALDRDTMLKERPKIEEALQRIVLGSLPNRSAAWRCDSPSTNTARRTTS